MELLSYENLSFCVHNGSLYEENNDLILIHLTPTSYWADHKALTYGNHFADEAERLLPEGYHLYVGTEHEIWCIEVKSKEEVKKELISLGMRHNQEMEDFLTSLF